MGFSVALADVARSAGSEIVRLVEMPADDQQIVAGAVLYDSTALLPDQPIDETRRSSILRLQVPPSVETDKDYRRVHAATGVLQVATADPLLRRTAVSIRAGDAVLGSLWLLERAEHHNEATNRILRDAARDIGVLDPRCGPGHLTVGCHGVRNPAIPPAAL